LNNNRRNFWLTGAALCLLVFIGGHKIRDGQIVQNNYQKSTNSDQITEHHRLAGLFGQVANAENENQVIKNERDQIRQLTQQWIEAQNQQEWSIQPKGEIKVIVDGDRAVSTFSWIGQGQYQDEQKMTSSRHATHVWQKHLDSWVIVHEHLTVAEK
jgi:DNA-binding transcriptional regulator YbjK